jgi:hypothetical protein
MRQIKDAAKLQAKLLLDSRSGSRFGPLFADRFESMLVLSGLGHNVGRDECVD